MDLSLQFKKYYFQVALLAIVTLAAALRFSGIHWGFYHPDEGFYTHIAWDFYRGEMDFGRIIGDWPNIIHYIIYSAAIISDSTIGVSLTADSIIIIGRYLSAFLSVITVYLCYLIGRKIHSINVGLLSAFISAIAHLPVLHAHYATLDTSLTFFLTLTLYFALKLAADDYNYKTLMITGILAGITMGIKYSGGIILLPTLILLLFNSSLTSIKKVHDTIIVLITSVFSFVVSCPFILGSFGTFTQSLSRLSQFEVGFYGLFPEFAENGWEWYFNYGLPWSYGRVLGGIIIISTIYCLIYSIKNKNIVILTLVATTFAYLIQITRYDMYMMRYLLPLTPIFAIIVAQCINDFQVKISEWTRPHGVRMAKISLTVITLVLIIHPLAYTIAYDNILCAQNVRIEASHWIQQNMDFEDQINIGPSPVPPSWMLPPLDKSRYMSQALCEKSDVEYYIICEPLAQHIYLRYLSEPNLYLDEDFIPWKPPSDGILDYYSQLSYNEIDYNLVATFKKTPQFLGVYTVNESNAPYEVTHVTHPELKIYKRFGKTIANISVESTTP